MYGVEFDSARKDACGLATLLRYKYPLTEDTVFFSSVYERLHVPYVPPQDSQLPRISIGMSSKANPLPSMEATLSMVSNSWLGDQHILFMLSGFSIDGRLVKLGRPLSKYSQFGATNDPNDCYTAFSVEAIPRDNQTRLLGQSACDGKWRELCSQGNTYPGGSPSDPFYFAKACLFGEGKTRRAPIIRCVGN
jgi:hypothetical protein